MKGITNKERDAMATLLNQQELGTFFILPDMVYMKRQNLTSPHLEWTPLVHWGSPTNSWSLVQYSVGQPWSLS